MVAVFVVIVVIILVVVVFVVVGGGVVESSPRVRCLLQKNRSRLRDPCREHP